MRLRLQPEFSNFLLYCLPSETMEKKGSEWIHFQLQHKIQLLLGHLIKKKKKSHQRSKVSKPYIGSGGTEWCPVAKTHGLKAGRALPPLYSHLSRTNQIHKRIAWIPAYRTRRNTKAVAHLQILTFVPQVIWELVTWERASPPPPLQFSRSLLDSTSLSFLTTS